MIFKSLLLFTSVLIIVTQSFSLENNQPFETEILQGRIIHVPVSYLRENEKLVIEARVDGTTERIIYMRLYFKLKGEQSFDYIEMTEGPSAYFGELAPSQFSPPELEYFILVLLSNHSILTSPESNPYGNPFVVSIASREAPSEEPKLEKPTVSEPTVREPIQEDTTQSLFEEKEREEESPILILSPEKGEEFDVGEEVVIAVSFLASEEAIDLESINLFIDGLNITPAAEIDENLLTYTTYELKPGIHRVLVQGYYRSGVELPEAKWSFRVRSGKRRALTESIVHGRVFAGTRQENISGNGFSDNTAGGNISGKYGKIKFDARVFLTSREDRLFQPRHRYAINVELPLLGITFGDTYPRFNDLMLWGKRVRGIYGRLHLGFFNVDVVHGETNRKVSAVQELVLDPETNNPLKNISGEDSTKFVSLGTYRQRLFGVRPSFGSGKNFQLGFNLLKVRDDVSSLVLEESSRPPQDNFVVGSDVLIAFDNHRIELKGGAALSFITNDISDGPLTKEKIEEQFDVSLPFNPADFKDFLIINASTVPLDPRDLSSLAWNFNFKFNYFNNNFQFGYKSIGSEYNSLGNTYLRTDIRGFYFRDRVRIFQNKIYLNFGYEDYDDNYSRKNQNPITNLKTINYGISIYPGSGVPNLNFTLRNHKRNNGVTVLDSLFNPTEQDTTFMDMRENNLTKDLSIQLNYDVNLFNLNHTVTAGYITSDRDDHFGSTRLNGQNLSEIATNVQLFSIRTQYKIPLITTFNFARNDNKFAAGLNTLNFKMFGGRAEYFLFNNKLRTYSGINYISASGSNVTAGVSDTTETITDYTRIAFNLGARFEISPGHFINVDGQLIRFKDRGKVIQTISDQKLISSNPSFTDRIFRIYYEKRF